MMTGPRDARREVLALDQLDDEKAERLGRCNRGSRAR
jgi:hypothetical protein